MSGNSLYSAKWSDQKMQQVIDLYTFTSVCLLDFIL